MRNASNSTFVALLIGMSLTGAALIVSIPPLFGPHEPYQPWTTGVLSVLFVALAVATLYVRPTRPRTSDRNADE